MNTNLRNMEPVKVIMTFASPKCSTTGKNFKEDLKEALIQVYPYLKNQHRIIITGYSCQNQEMGVSVDKEGCRINTMFCYKGMIDDSFSISLLWPKNLPEYRIPMHLRGIALYLLKNYPQRYEKGKVNSRLFNYKILSDSAKVVKDR